MREFSCETHSLRRTRTVNRVVKENSVQFVKKFGNLEEGS